MRGLEYRCVLHSLSFDLLRPLVAPSCYLEVVLSGNFPILQESP